MSSTPGRAAPWQYATRMAWQLPAHRREIAVGDMLGGYRLEEQLGEGAMGLVFRAVRESDGVTVALKVLKVSLSEDDTYKQRFLHEARAAADVRHENLVPIVEAGEIDGRHFLAVEYVAGPTLAQRIESGGPLPVDALVRLAEEVGAALDALHERELVHRDVKASNVLLADGTALLTDFGLAKGPAYTVLTRPGQVLGTLEYLAPELIRGEPATRASDLYALGCMVYECATGKTPFGDRSMFEVGMAHLDEEPGDPGAGRDDWPAALSAAVLEALRKDAELRPPSAAAYTGMLERAVAGP
jgi:serine/threonine protein kinase